jgi:hypothetical protein
MLRNIYQKYGPDTTTIPEAAGRRRDIRRRAGNFFLANEIFS